MFSQRENRLATQREITEKIMPRNHKNNVKTGLWLKEIMPKESVPRNHKNNVKTGLRLKEIMPKESVPKNHKSNVKIIAWHSGTAKTMIIP